MSRTWSNFVSDRYESKTNCVMYKSSLPFTNVSNKGYPDSFNIDSTGAVTAGSEMKKCEGNKSRSSHPSSACTNLGADAGSIMCPSGKDLLLRYQIGPRFWRYADSTAYTFMGYKNQICFTHDDPGKGITAPQDCYYATFDKCGKLDSTSCDIGSANAIITGHKLLDPEIDYSNEDAAKKDGVRIPQTTSNTANLNGEGVVACYYQYDLSTFITNGSNSRKLASWINDLYDGMNYIV